MRWLITGATGQVGSRLVALLTASSSDAVVGPTRTDLDITSASAIGDALDRYRPEVIVNAAAFTDVDGAERDAPAAAQVNAIAPGLLAVAAAARGVRLIHVSTDYVFAGDADHAYEPGDSVGPRSVYGRTKLAGEARVLDAGGFVTRTAWVYGGQHGFVATIGRCALDGASVRVVSDQVGSPTYAADLAGALIELGQAEMAPTLLHYVNSGQASRYELAVAVYQALGADSRLVTPIPTASIEMIAIRPAWSVLSTASWTAAGLAAPRPWQDALAASTANVQKWGSK